MYVKIYGTFGSTRKEMFKRYGEEWAFQYDEKEWQDWEHKRPMYIMETLLEKIGGE